MTTTRHQRSPLGAFYRSPLGAFGAGEGELEQFCLWGTITTQTDDTSRSYGIYNEIDECEFRANTDPPIGHLLTDFQFDPDQPKPSPSILGYDFVGVTSAAQFKPLNLIDQLYCLQTLPTARNAKNTFGPPYSAPTNLALIFQHQVDDVYGTDDNQDLVTAITNYGRFPGSEISHPTGFVESERFYACPEGESVFFGTYAAQQFADMPTVSSADCSVIFANLGQPMWRERLIFQNADMPAGITETKFRELTFRDANAQSAAFRPASEHPNYFCGNWDDAEGVKHYKGSVTESPLNPGYFFTFDWDFITRDATETTMDIWRLSVFIPGAPTTVAASKEQASA